MKRRSECHVFLVVSVAVLALATTLPTSAQSGSGATLRVRTPGTAFTAEGSGVRVDDVPGGRRFRAEPKARITLRGSLRVPAPESGEPLLKRLALHFRASDGGPRVHAVELVEGSSVILRIPVYLGGDYGARETFTPDFAANAWEWDPPVRVSSRTTVRVVVQFPTGFDSPIDPGDLVMVDVAADFPRDLSLLGSARNLPREETRLGTGPPPSPFNPQSPPASAAGVVYAVDENDDLLWYQHLGHEDGSFRWAADVPRTVGSGWSFDHVFSGGDGVVYAITSGGDLLWYRHEGRADGSFRWAQPEARRVGTGWTFPRVFSGGDGVIYAITEGGDLLWYRHKGRSDGSGTWVDGEGRKIGEGWSFPRVFAGDGGVIYAVTESGDLLWYRHDGWSDGSPVWASPEGRRVGTGWSFEHLFSSGDGVIYAITGGGDLLWYRHTGHRDGSATWESEDPRKVGTGWRFGTVFSGAALVH